nr:proline-rich receptor-like protein kinase PERK2 [Lolium perenne]
MLPSSRSNAARGGPRPLQAPTHVRVAPAQQAQIGPMKPRSGPHSILLSPPPGDTDLAGLEAADLCSPRLSPAELLAPPPPAPATPRAAPPRDLGDTDLAGLEVADLCSPRLSRPSFSAPPPPAPATPSAAPLRSSPRCSPGRTPP